MHRKSWILASFEKKYSNSRKEKKKKKHIKYVICIDDDQRILNIIKEQLKERLNGYKIVTFSDPNEALEIIESHIKASGDILVLAIVDQVMPKIKGHEVLRKIKEIFPESGKVLLTGYSDKEVLKEAINIIGIDGFLEKPWDIDKFYSVVKQAIERSELAYKNKELIDELKSKENELKKLFLQTILAFTKAVDAKDPYTRGHSERVALYTMIIVEELEELGKKFSDEEKRNILIAALLHDIGKILIDDAILKKAKKLTTEEYLLMQFHATIAADILGPIDKFQEIIPGIIHHHERLDGTGYPLHLKGDDIPFMARIIAVADAYDAMTTNRLYRKKIDPKEAIEEIKRNSGTQFDPLVVDAIYNAYKKGRLNIENLSVEKYTDLL